MGINTNHRSKQPARQEKKASGTTNSEEQQHPRVAGLSRLFMGLSLSNKREKRMPAQSILAPTTYSAETPKKTGGIIDTRTKARGISWNLKDVHVVREH